MLILERRADQEIIIDGRIIVKILRIDRETVKVGIEAPSDIEVDRMEVHKRKQANGAMRSRPRAVSSVAEPQERAAP